MQQNMNSCQIGFSEKNNVNVHTWHTHLKQFECPKHSCTYLLQAAAAAAAAAAATANTHICVPKKLHKQVYDQTRDFVLATNIIKSSLENSSQKHWQRKALSNTNTLHTPINSTNKGMLQSVCLHGHRNQQKYNEGLEHKDSKVWPQMCK